MLVVGNVRCNSVLSILAFCLKMLKQNSRVSVGEKMLFMLLKVPYSKLLKSMTSLMTLNIRFVSVMM